MAEIKQERIDFNPGPLGTFQGSAANPLTVGGGAMGGGDMPTTKLNNPFSGHVMIIVPDVMSAPLAITYLDVWNVVKMQHPLATKPDVTLGNSSEVSLTVLKVEFYGASAGIISMTPFIQRAPTTYGYPLVTDVDIPTAAVTMTQPYYQHAQQVVDVGTITSKPRINHSFGDSINNTRVVNNTPITNVTLYNTDALFEYQYIQKAATPVPVDAGYLRISFILRQNLHIPLDNAFPLGSDLAVYKTYDELVAKSRKRSHEQEKMWAIDKVRRLTLPILD